MLQHLQVDFCAVRMGRGESTLKPLRVRPVLSVETQYPQVPVGKHILKRVPSGNTELRYASRQAACNYAVVQLH